MHKFKPSIKSITLAVILALSAPVFALEEPANTQSVNSAVLQLLENDAIATVKLVEEASDLRAQLPSFISDASKAIKSHNGALPASYANTIIESLSVAEKQRDGLFNQALKHRSALYRVDANASDHERLNGIIISMSSAITLFENNNALQKAFAGNRLLRKKLDEGYPEFGVSSQFYNSSMTRASNPEYVKNMLDAIKFFNDNKAIIAAQMSQSSPNIQALYRVVAASPLLNNFKGANVFKEIFLIPVKLADATFSISKSELGRVKFTTSKVAGNSMGAVRWRDGKLKNDVKTLEALLADLQPGDILLDKTPFTLTDKSIPGHFGHAAIYTGTAEQLKAIGADKKPLIAKQMSQIAKGRGVVEALRSGVELNPLNAFMNIDDVAVLRLKNVTPAQQADIVNLAVANLGKKYDFNFDVNTTDKIVCSELVYIAYPQVDFVTKNVLGSFTVSPDDIAMGAGGEPKDALELVFFAHEGKIAIDSKTAKNRYSLYDNLVKKTAKSSPLINVKNQAGKSLISQ